MTSESHLHGSLKQAFLHYISLSALGGPDRLNSSFMSRAENQLHSLDAAIYNKHVSRPYFVPLYLLTLISFREMWSHL
jgi:hypothetical protein